MNYHARIMNIRGYQWASSDYHEGHKVARHDAAEIAAEADGEVERLTADLAAARAEVERDARSFGKLHNIIGGLEGDIERLTAERDEAERTLATIKDEYPKLRSQLAAARAERDGLAIAAQALVDTDDSTPAPDGGIHVTFAELDAFTERWTKARDALRAALAALPTPPKGET